MDALGFRRALRTIIESKVHWAGSAFAAQSFPIDAEQEYATYVRDVGVMIGWAYVQCPIVGVRRQLAEALHAAETRELARFERVELLMSARAYRALIDEYTQKHGWPVAVAVTMLFLDSGDREHGERAWRMIIDHVPANEYLHVVEAMSRTRDAWLAYRDAVAAACGLSR